MPMPPVKRVLLKLSGEVLMGDQQFGIDPAFVAELAKEVRAAKETGLEICLVIGGGNIFRGMAGAVQGMDRAQAGKAAGTSIVLKDYVRFQLGEGIEKEASDFAAEVAAAVAG